MLFIYSRPFRNYLARSSIDQVGQVGQARNRKLNRGGSSQVPNYSCLKSLHAVHIVAVASLLLQCKIVAVVEIAGTLLKGIAFKSLG